MYMTQTDHSRKGITDEYLFMIRLFLAASCLLAPTFFTLTTQCEVESIVRMCIGVVAFSLLRQPRSQSDSKAECISVEELRPDAVADLKCSVFRAPTALKLEQQVSDLVKDVEPNVPCKQIIQDLSSNLQQLVDMMLPGAVVEVFLSGQFRRGTPYIVSVPEIEVVIHATEEQLSAGVHKDAGRCRSQSGASQQTDGEPPKKMLRVLLKEMMKQSPQLRFQRSSFTRREAKVTLVETGLSDDTYLVAFDLSLNAREPLCNSVLVSACASWHSNVKDLMLLVRRWAKVRGLCNASLGQWSPYAWNLLVVYFLQTGKPAVLPPLQCGNSSGRPSAHFVGSPTSVPSVVSLFKDFIAFYNRFDWDHEQVCVTRGYSPCVAASCKGAPTVLDPFSLRGDMDMPVATDAVDRVRSEIALAWKHLMIYESPLDAIMQKWVPEHVEKPLQV